MGIELWNTKDFPDDIIIGDKTNMGKYTFNAGAKNAGFPEYQARQLITLENIPNGREGEDDFHLPPSFNQFFVSKSESLGDFEFLVKAIHGGWGKAMMRNIHTGNILFRSCTWCTDHHFASKYIPSHDPSWNVGRKCFNASKRFWRKCATYFEEHPM
jgi:hypothetical protein